MCEVCGCANADEVHVAGSIPRFDVRHAMLHQNDHQTAHDRAHFDAAGHLRSRANAASVLEISARGGAGLTLWIDRLIAQRAAVQAAQTARPLHAGHLHA